jgi:hypothetical protein
VLVQEAATDERERSFANTVKEVIAAWAEGLRDSDVHRTIWVGDVAVGQAGEVLAAATPEFASVPTADRSPDEIAADIARLESSSTV